MARALVSASAPFVNDIFTFNGMEFRWKWSKMKFSNVIIYLAGLCRSLSKPKTTQSQQTWRRWMTEQSRRFSNSCFRGGQWRSKHKGWAKCTQEGKWVCVILRFTKNGQRPTTVAVYLFSLFILMNIFLFLFFMTQPISYRRSLTPLWCTWCRKSLPKSDWWTTALAKWR